ncbi:MAG: CDP-diacylglycerol--glycerol-3-phosphate 3-phosphatidyltransferase [Robiginitomaculum sp.]|nr:CDP-diacylglycerol--glycerol-3-phosphate 3-phosphatidyltransferase [Robiginitomaculum sp.]
MQISSPRHSLYWLPNALTLSRIALIPLLIWGILSAEPPPNMIALSIFIYCAITDFLDGYLARKWKLVSDFGRMLDPIADKLLVAGCLMAFMIKFGGSWIILVPSIAIIFRDIFISGTREHAANADIILSPTKLAKWKTATEMLAITLLLVGLAVHTNAHTSALMTHIGFGFLWLAACLSLYTGLHYIRETFR